MQAKREAAVLQPRPRQNPHNEQKSVPNGHGLLLLVCGGDEGDRTPYLLNAIQALSQLERLHTPAKRAKERFNTRELLSLIPANK